VVNLVGGERTAVAVDPPRDVDQVIAAAARRGVLEANGTAVAVFTGGSLLIGTVGRPDLVEPRLTERLARAQHASAHRLAAELPDDTAVLPTHGFGSFCSSSRSQKPR
jgi:hypothetical protein